MDLYIYEGKAYADSQHTTPFSGKVCYGDEFELTIHFPEGLIEAGQTVMVAYDNDMLFGEDGTSPMGKATGIVVNPLQMQFVLPTNTEKFYDVVNGKRIPVCCYLGVYLFDDADESDSGYGYPQRQLCLANIQAMPVVALLSDTIVPVEPKDVYYTKSEVDANFISNAQKGVANGVATLDENGKVPTSELPAMNYIPTSEKGVASGVATLDAQGKVPAGELPIATSTTIGAIRTEAGYGMQIQSTNCIAVIRAVGTDIDAKSNDYKPIVPHNLDYAVRSVQPNITVIPAATSAYSLLDASATTNSRSYCYQHTPDAAPTYTLPDVSSTSIVHEIVLVVDFANAGSVAFQNSQGTTIAPLPSASPIEQGKTFAFLCTYQAVLSKWVIMPIYLEVE